jgi:hypothetical protein
MSSDIVVVQADSQATLSEQSLFRNSYFVSNSTLFKVRSSLWVLATGYLVWKIVQEKEYHLCKLIVLGIYSITLPIGT